MREIILKSTQAIQEVYDEASVLAAEGYNPWPAMTFHDGVARTLAWVLGEDSSPLEDD